MSRRTHRNHQITSPWKNSKVTTTMRDNSLSSLTSLSRLYRKVYCNNNKNKYILIGESKGVINWRGHKGFSEKPRSLSSPKQELWPKYSKKGKFEWERGLRVKGELGGCGNLGGRFTWKYQVSIKSQTEVITKKITKGGMGWRGIRGRGNAGADDKIEIGVGHFSLSLVNI